MNGTARVIIPATITEIGDGPYYYAACKWCYSKVVESLSAYDCLKCGRSFPCSQIEFRYRLNMTITDGTTYATVTAFGGMLNTYFGCTASEFNKRWISKLQNLFGSLERPLTKWAVEESLFGCCMHFGFKVDSKSLRTQRAQDRSYGPSLRDVKQLCKGIPYSRQADSNLVALQVICQNESQHPSPVTLYLQNAVSFYEDLNSGGGENVEESPSWTRIQQFIQEKYARNRQSNSYSSQTPSSYDDQLEDCSSVLSSMDQTSIGFNDCDFTSSSKSQDRSTINQDSYNRHIASNQSSSTEVTPALSSTPVEDYASCELSMQTSWGGKKNKMLQLNGIDSSKSIGNAEITSAHEVLIKGNNIDEHNEDCEGSILLFNSPLLCNYDEGEEYLELPRDNSSLLNTFALSNVPKNNECSLYSIADSTNKFLDHTHSHLNLCEDQSYNDQQSLSTLESDDSLYNSVIRFERRELEKEGGTTSIHGSESTNLDSVQECEKDKRSFLKSCHTKLKRNEKADWSNCNAENLIAKSVDNCSQYSSSVSFNQNLSCHSMNVSKYTPNCLDMPDSEELDLFLEVANDVSGHHLLLPLNNYSKSSDDQGQLPSLFSKSTESKQTGHAHDHTSNEFENATADDSLIVNHAKTKTAASHVIDQKLHLHVGTTASSQSNEHRKPESSNPGTTANDNILGHETNDFQGGFATKGQPIMALSKQHQAILAPPYALEPFLGNECVTNVSFKDLASTDDELGQMDDSGDLFSSQEQEDLDVLGLFKSLAIEDKMIPQPIRSIGPTTLSNMEEIRVSTGVYNEANVREMLYSYQDQSFDLFSTQASKTIGDDSGGSAELEWNSSIDLFSSSEEI